MTDGPSRLATFFAELKRRRVFRVGAAYLVGAWVVVEVATQTFPYLGLSDQLVTGTIILAALGFPAALVLAWVFDIERTRAAGETGSGNGTGRGPLTLAAPWVGVGIVLAIVVLGAVTMVPGPAPEEGSVVVAGLPRDPLAEFPGQRHALLVGYANDEAASADATALYDFLRSPAAVGGVRSSNMTLLVDAHATAAGIRAALADLKERSSPGDVVLVFIAGAAYPMFGSHPDSGRAILLAADYHRAALSPGEGWVRIDSMPGAVPLDEIGRALADVPARQLMLFVDASRMRFTLRSDTGEVSLVAPVDVLAHGRRSDGGFAFFNAGSLGQVSQVRKWWDGRHGVFTFYLLRGLRGAADEDGDRVVTLDELMEYTRREVRELTDGEQVPTTALTRFDGSWPMAVVPPDAPDLGPAPEPFHGLATDRVVAWDGARSGDVSRYRTVLDSLATGSSLDSDEHFARGIRAFRTDAYDRAAEHFRTAAALQPCSRDAWLNLTQALYVWNNLLEDGADSAPDTTDPQVTPSEAIVRELVLAGSRVLDLDPLNRNAMTFLLRSARQAGEKELADRMFERYRSGTVEVSEIRLSKTRPVEVSATVTNLGAAPGDTIRLRFTLLDEACSAIGSSVLAAPMPGKQEQVELRGSIDAAAEVRAWRYHGIGL